MLFNLTDVAYLLYTIIDQTLLKSLHWLMNCKIGVQECRQSIKHVSIVYTCNTFFVMHWSM